LLGNVVEVECSGNVRLQNRQRTAERYHHYAPQAGYAPQAVCGNVELGLHG
jgi:hypothetical protein